MSEITITDKTLGSERLWGAVEIAAFLGVSTDTVYAWAEDLDVPIYKPIGSGRLFAFRSELLRWLRSKPRKPEPS